MRKIKRTAEKTETSIKEKIYKTFTADIISDVEAKTFFKTVGAMAASPSR